MKHPKVGFVGFGKMASILAEGAVNAGFIPASSIVFNRRDVQKAQELATEFGFRFEPLETVIKQADYLFLAIKPQQFQELGPILKPSIHSRLIIVSVMAGISISTIKDVLGAVPVARVMPNTPALLGEGMSAITFDSLFHPPQKAFVRSFFESVGGIIEIPEPAHHAATAISGCGPAFFYALADAIAEEGQQQGLSYEQALSLCAQTLIGAGHMLVEAGKSPAALIKDVASPGGATQAGLDQLTDLQLPQHIRAVIRAAYNRSVTLGQLKEH